MTEKHSYINPSEKQDLSHLEASAGGEYLDEHGWPTTPPMSDRECIYRSLENCINLAGLDKKQVMRLAEDFKTKKTEVVRNEEYPVL